MRKVEPTYNNWVTTNAELHALWISRMMSLDKPDDEDLNLGLVYARAYMMAFSQLINLGALAKTHPASKERLELIKIVSKNYRIISESILGKAVTDRAQELAVLAVDKHNLEITNDQLLELVDTVVFKFEKTPLAAMPPLLVFKDLLPNFVDGFMGFRERLKAYGDYWYSAQQMP